MLCDRSVYTTWSSLLQDGGAYFFSDVIVILTAHTLFTQDHVAALVRSPMNGLLPFESTLEQTTEKKFPLATKQ